MLGIGGFNDAARALAAVLAVVADPFFAEDVEAEVRPSEIACFRLSSEGVGGGAEAHDRLAGVEVVGEVRELRIGKLAETSADDEEVGRFQSIGTGDVVLVIGIDVAALGIDGEEDRAIEAEALAEDLGKHRAGFLAAVFFIARDEDDFFAIGGPSFGGEVQPFLRGGVEGEGSGDEGGQPAGEEFCRIHRLS